MEINKMPDEAIKARREYYRLWREKNKDRVRVSNQKYWEKVAIQMKEQQTEV